MYVVVQLLHVVRSIPPVDVRHLATLQAEVENLRHEPHVVNLEGIVVVPLVHDAPYERDFVLVEILPHRLYLPYVAEELRAQVAVPVNSLLYSLKVRENELRKLLLRGDVPVGKVLHALIEPLQLRVYDRIVYLLLALEISVQRAPAFARRQCNVIHCRAFKSLLCKQLPCYVYE